ncbi:MAG: Asp-tRNA(Asn)/Glu-tRNA(Gln) amidotransferase subunit GatB [Acidimicrobiales bacterium]|nr:Asp-tRNA(Asn)/Glu-tRNA(Gln) amidotransferase subunit GatB [Acidimicrobiales bacterium]
MRHEPSLPEDWELVCGLEVHVELSTATKLFCGCANQFGSEPNTNVCPTCLGLPGSLPMVNESAVTNAMRLGRALNCTVLPSVFARKNYFYPDMPKDFQTTQYDQPTNDSGWLDIPTGERIGVERAHIEEDTGKTTHVGGDGRITSAQYSLIDYNRAGVPLVEVVSRPDIRTADEAKQYVSELRGILLALDVSDARMEEGSMRVDANVSIRPVGSDKLRTRCEIKNINSLSSLGRAIAHEANRHLDLYTTGDAPVQETRHWDEESGRTRSGRRKEDSDDYRYFPEPDLTPLIPSADELDAIERGLPVFPAEQRSRLAEAAGIESTQASLIVGRGDADFALATIDAGADGARVVVHLDNNLADGIGELTPASFAELVKMETGGALSATQTKDVLAEMVTSGQSAADIAAARGFEAMDTSELDGMVDELIANHPDEWSRFCGDDEGDAKKMAGFFTGQIMKATKGQADGKVVAQLLNARK